MMYQSGRRNTLVLKLKKVRDPGSAALYDDQG